MNNITAQNFESIKYGVSFGGMGVHITRQFDNLNEAQAFFDTEFDSIVKAYGVRKYRVYDVRRGDAGSKNWNDTMMHKIVVRNIKKNGEIGQTRNYVQLFQI